MVGRFRPSFHGPNPYSRDPVIVAELAFAEGAEDEGPRRCALMSQATSTWFNPPASFERCGTRIGIAEFLAQWTLCALNYRRGVLHTGAAFDNDGRIVAAVGFHDPKLSRSMLALALALFNGSHPSPQWYDERLKRLWAACVRRHPDYQAAFNIQAARDADIPYMFVLPPFKTWQFGWGVRGELTLESLGGRDSELGDRISREKPECKAFLRGLGVPMPPHVLVDGSQDLASAADRVGWPCVVKPRNGGRSIGVLTDITDLDRLAAAVEETLAKHGSPAMIESQVPGEVYRILVARRRCVHVVRRAVAHVTGDGVHTVGELIDAENRRQAGLRQQMTFVEEIPLDEECLAALARAKVGLEDVLPRGRRLPLRRIPMLTSGAVYTDVTAETHPHTKRMAEMMAASLGLDNCGIDFITTDIARSMAEEGRVLELNTIPSMRVHLAAGLDPAAVGRLILGDGPGRIPSALVVAPLERLRELRRSLTFDDTTGWAIQGRAGIGPIALSLPEPGDDTRSLTQRGAAMIVRNPCVERIFVAVSLEGIVRAGLPLDRFDTIVCLDCAPDARWERVMREAAGSYVATSEPKVALRKCAPVLAP